jgi:hypothetical protein
VFHTLEGANSNLEGLAAVVVAVVVRTLGSSLVPHAPIARLNVKQAAADANRQLLNDHICRE